MATPVAPNFPTSHSPYSGRSVTAVLGPTNTGKTHLAIERMLGHETGVIGLPLRLLAREVYDKVCKRVGAENVALITGEEKIKPKEPRYYVCTVEAMPQDLQLDFAAIDEVQLAADPDRGHVFTDRLLHTRGTHETLMLGADTMHGLIEHVLPGANFVTRPRLSKLSYSGEKKVSRLPRRSAIVAFSANNVYEVAELIRRQRGGAAVVLGALSPRTRNAQVELYQSGDVDFVVATDAIGMGLNLEIDHVAFAGSRKFDGQTHRELRPAELAQIAGRAGRHLNDGTFGVTGDVAPFDSELVMQLEDHQFEPVKLLQWRNRELDFSSVQALKTTLIQPPTHPQFARARVADDLTALENITRLPETKDRVSTADDVRRLWEVCQIPDYRKIGVNQHAEILTSIFQFLADDRLIPDDWFQSQVDIANRTDGDIDTLANRIAHVRTWNFIANRTDWMAESERWQAYTRDLEDKLSDALHERLVHRFVDQRTSVLMKRLRDEEELEATISDDGKVSVETHLVGQLEGFKFTPETLSEGVDGKAARHAAAQVLDKEFSMRVRRFVAAKADAFTVTPDAEVKWRGETVARLEASDNRLRPQVSLISDDHLSAPDTEKVQKRLDTFIDELIDERLKPLIDLSKAEDFNGIARGVAFRLCENFGALRRESVAEDIRSLDQTARGQLRKCGVRFGAFNIFIPLLLKPKPVELLQVLWKLTPPAGASIPEDGFARAPNPGLTSVAADSTLDDHFYQVCGYHLCGPRAVRVDMLERLADMIRPLVAWRKPRVKKQPPKSEAQSDAGTEKTDEAGETSDPKANGATEQQPEQVTGQAADRAKDTPATETSPVADAASADATAPADAVAPDTGEQAQASPDTEAEAKPATTPEAASGAAAKPARHKDKAKSAEAPAGSTGDGGFTTQPDMMSILGCSSEELAAVLKSLGFRMQKVPLSNKAKAERAKAAGKAVAPAATPAETDDAAATSDTAADNATVADGTSETSPTPAPQDVAASSETAIPAPSETEAEEEEEFDIVWRPKRKQHHGGDRRRGRGGEQAASKGDDVRARDTGRGGKPSGDNRARKGGKPGGHKGGPRKGAQGRGGKPAGGDRQRSWTSAAPKKKAEADPNNPFAALGALKSQLEGGSDKDKD